MSLEHLKRLPCPAGDQCTAFKCLFGHEKDTKLPAPAASQRENTQGAREPPSQLPGQTPKKRQKLASHHHTDKSPSSVTQPHDAKGSTKDSKDNKTIIPAKRHIPSTTRTVSPPPLRRKHVTSPKQDQQIKMASSPSAKDGSPSGSKDSKSNKASDRKPETLNPRLLKASPATHAVRLKLLKLLHFEYARLNGELKKDANKDEEPLVLSDQELIWRALDEEEKTANGSPSIYANVIKNRITSYKRMSVRQWKEERAAEVKAAQEKQQQGSRTKRPAEPPKEIKTGLAPAQEVQILRRLLTPIDKLAEHGYVPAVPRDEDVVKAQSGREAAQGWERCDRCGQRFQVFPGRREEDGALASGGSCTHHWGKTYFPAQTPGDPGRPPKRYKCCGQSVGDSAGCTTSPHHVFKVSAAAGLAALWQFAETPRNDRVAQDMPDRAVCFDCEMCYTVHGMELVRLTATAWPGRELLLDVLVQPVGEILDLNSRFSGVWPEQFAAAEAWSAARDEEGNNDDGSDRKLRKVAGPEVARDLLFSLIAPTTPLIGHGLENDLNAVRVVHPTLADTVLLYPHRRGLPFRHGLKMLMEQVLGRQIQVEGDEEGVEVRGHDSAEDARAAGELVLFKVMKEWEGMRSAGWRFQGGEFVPPPENNGKAEGALTEGMLEENMALS